MCYPSDTPVFHMTYCTRYCLKSPLEHLTITFSFQTGLYFFQHWFFFRFLSCLSKEAEGKGHAASRLIGQELDLLHVLVVFRPTGTSFLLLQTQSQLCSILWGGQDIEIYKTLWSTRRPRFLHISLQSLRKIDTGIVRMESSVFPTFQVVCFPRE